MAGERKPWTPVELRLDCCVLRPWRRGDEPSLVRHANNRNVWRTLRDLFPHPYKAEDAADWVCRAGTLASTTQFAIEVDGEAVGGIGFSPGEDVYRRSAEVGFWLGEDYWGRGIVTEALIAITSYAFERFDICRVHAQVFESNPASMRVLEKAGYSLEGRMRLAVTKDEQTLDQLVYAVVSED